MVKTFIEEVINSGNLGKVDELAVPDRVNNDPNAPAHAPGAEGIKELIGAYRAGFQACTLRPVEYSPPTARSPISGP